MTNLCLTINAAAKPIELGEISLSPGVGIKGADGLSAYEIAVKNGFNGTEQEWLNTLGGYTPVRGTDYWTAADITTMESYINSYINTVILGGAS